MAVVSVPTLEEKCPFCNKPLDIHFLHLKSGLGSPTAICRFCRKLIGTGRVEWRNMAPAQKRSYVLTSLVYLCFVGFFGGYSFLFTYENAFKIPSHNDRPPNFLGTPFVIGFILWAGFIFLLQTFRVFSSIHRSTAVDPPPARGLWNLQNFVQGKVILLLMAMPLATWLIRKLADM